MKSKACLNVTMGKGVGLTLVFALFVLFSVARGAEEKSWSIQVASYKTIEEAREDQRKLEIRQFSQVRIEKIADSTFPYRLLLGHFTREKDSLQTLERVKSLFPAAFRKTFWGRS